MTEPDPFARYLLFIRTQLSDARIRHSIGVMQVIADLAPIYSLDIHPNLAPERDALAAKLAVPASFFDRE